MRQQFGAKPKKSDLIHYQKSNNFADGVFKNLEMTKIDIGFQSLPKILYRQFFEKEGRKPVNKLPVAQFRPDVFLKESESVKFIWYGHSALLIRIAGRTLLIDPMFGSNAAPISPFSADRFSKNTLSIIDELPEIDLVLISHDHYDHLDLDSILKLKSKTKAFVVALGVKRHLEEWGVDVDIIEEMDWWQSVDLYDIKIFFTPSRHFSGRGLTDRAKSLWGGWVLKTANESIWFSGDGGYGSHFKEIGDRLGSFDFGFIECGQYNEYWHQIHMYPEEGVQAAQDAGTKVIMPVHWGGFSLAMHRWQEPADRFVQACVAQDQKYIVPGLGEIVQLNALPSSTLWWQINHK